VGKKRSESGLFYIILLLLFIYLVYIARQALFPFIVSLGIAYLFDPLLDRLEEKMDRTFAVTIVLSSFFIVTLLVCLSLYPLLEHQVVKGMQKMPEYTAIAKEKIKPILEGFGDSDSGTTNELINTIMEKVGSIPSEIITGVYNSTLSLFSSLAGVISALFSLVVIPVASFYFMRDIDTIKERAVSLIPRDYEEDILTLLKDINKTLSSFVRGQFTVVLSLSFFYSLGLYFIGTPMGLFVGLIAGFSNIVPYLPLVAGLIPSLILTYLHFGLDTHLLMVLALFAGGSLLEGFYLTPKVMGKSIGLHPVAIMLAVLIGGLAFGFVGLILAVPVAAVILVLLKHTEKNYRQSDLYNGVDDADDSSGGESTITAMKKQDDQPK